MKSHVAPLAGKVIEILSANGDLVDPGQIVLTLESMKVHVKVEAEVAGRVLDLRVKLNDSVGRGEVLIPRSKMNTRQVPLRLGLNRPLTTQKQLSHKSQFDCIRSLTMLIESKLSKSGMTRAICPLERT